MKHLKNQLTKIATYATALTITSPAFAQAGIAVPEPRGFEIASVGQFISAAIGVALIIAGILVFVYLVWGGLQWIMSGGDKAKTDEARSRITAALVGLTIVATAWAVMQLIEAFFGISLATDDLPSATGN